MVEDAYEFLNGFPEDDLVDWGVLEHSSGPARGEQYLLRGKTLGELLVLMAEHRKNRLEHGDWWLSQDGNFNNPSAPAGQSGGHFAELSRPGYVFWRQNNLINPYFRVL